MSLAHQGASEVCLSHSGQALLDGLPIDGLRQRVQLFERILADLVGPRMILQRQLLPPVFVSEPALCGLRPTSGLRAYVADLVCCPDRVWRVMGDLAADNHSSARLLEASALAGFLPGLCRFLLAEPLRLASVPSRWLADSGALQEIVRSPHRWTIVDAFRRASPAPPLADLPLAQRIALQDAVDREPSRFVARMVVDGPTERVALTRAEHGGWQAARLTHSRLA